MLEALQDRGRARGGRRPGRRRDGGKRTTGGRGRGGGLMSSGRVPRSRESSGAARSGDRHHARNRQSCPPGRNRAQVFSTRPADGRSSRSQSLRGTRQIPDRAQHISRLMHGPRPRRLSRSLQSWSWRGEDAGAPTADGLQRCIGEQRSPPRRRQRMLGQRGPVDCFRLPAPATYRLWPLRSIDGASLDRYDRGGASPHRVDECARCLALRALPRDVVMGPNRPLLRFQTLTYDSTGKGPAQSAVCLGSQLAFCQALSHRRTREVLPARELRPACRKIAHSAYHTSHHPPPHLAAPVIESWAALDPRLATPPWRHPLQGRPRSAMRNSSGNSTCVSRSVKL